MVEQHLKYKNGVILCYFIVDKRHEKTKSNKAAAPRCLWLSVQSPLIPTVVNMWFDFLKKAPKTAGKCTLWVDY